MMDQNEKKLNVAKAAVKHIHNDCLLGMGTGSTVNFLIDLLPEIKNKISAVASSSVQTENLLKMNGFEVQALNQLGMLDLYIDGADEATKNLHLIKGGGGALTREKILAENSKKFICIADLAQTFTLSYLFCANQKRCWRKLNSRQWNKLILKILN